ncbi:MAG: 1-acyl-sn-glycerol-3-phosphate acyltransferase [Myxococcales bacterium]|nr:1-acyl-sn-glycerol-3-phosphate acyltransferase [Myxococcales bacterium]
MTSRPDTDVPGGAPSTTSGALVPRPTSFVLAWFYGAVFSKVAVDPEWVRELRALSDRGSVVYVLRSRSYLDFFALSYFVDRFALPTIAFVMHLGLWLLEPLLRGTFWSGLFGKRPPERSTLEQAVRDGRSALLFLRAPAAVGRTRRGEAVSLDHVRWLVEEQRRSDRPILLVPQVIVWGRSPDHVETGVFDQIFGRRDYPGRFRVFAQFFWYLRRAILRAGEPLDLRQILHDNDALGAQKLDDEALVNRVHWILATRLDRERRVILGPRARSPERTIEEVLRHPHVRAAIDDAVQREKKSADEVTAGARREMVRLAARPAPWLFPWAEKVMDAVFNRIYDGIEVDEDGLKRVREAARQGPVVLLPSHKSHLDYLLMSYVCWRAGMAIPLIAAGDNLAFWPAGPVLRRFGAFFIRRSFGGARLYTTLVDTYLRKLLSQWTTIEFFIEGGRSRTGKLLAPKLGLLTMITEAAESTATDVAYVPISIGYERVVEERSFVHELSGGEKKAEDAGQLASSLPRVLASRYGRAYIQVGEIQRFRSAKENAHTESSAEAQVGQRRESVRPPSAKRALIERANARRAEAQVLADTVMREINRVTPVTPAALVATALLSRRRGGMPREELLEHIDALVSDLRASGARFASALAVGYEGGNRPYRVDAIDQVIALFVDGKSLEVHGPAHDAIYHVPEARRIALDYYKNNLLHFFVARAIVATAALAATQAGGASSTAHERSAPVRAVREEYDALCAMFSKEFSFDADREREFSSALAGAVARRELVIDGASATIPDRAAVERLRFDAGMLRNFVEAWWLTARATELLDKGSIPAKELVNKALSLGQRWLLTGELTRREAVTRPLIERAFAQWREAGVLVGGDSGPQRRTERFSERSAVDALVREVGRYL